MRSSIFVQISKQWINLHWIHCDHRTYWKNMSNSLTHSTALCMRSSAEMTQMATVRIQSPSKRRRALSSFRSRGRIKNASAPNATKWMKSGVVSPRFCFWFSTYQFSLLGCRPKVFENRWENGIKQNKRLLSSNTNGVGQLVLLSSRDVETREWWDRGIYFTQNYGINWA